MTRSRRLGPITAPLLLFGAAGNTGASDTDTLKVPSDYREWVYLSSGLDMSYGDAAPMTGHSTFVTENRAAESRGSINKQGHFQTVLTGTQFHVRDEKRFKGGWGFFASTGGARAAMIPRTAECYSCHQAHGAVRPYRMTHGATR